MPGLGNVNTTLNEMKDEWFKIKAWVLLLL